jgi:putative transposase
MSRSVYYYKARRDPQTRLRARLKELAASRPRYGYLRLHLMLRREGWKVNRKRIYRLYLEEGLQVRTKRRKKYASHQRVPPPKVSRYDERWSMDFVTDHLAGGKRFRVLTLVELYNRECLALRAGFSLRGKDVVEVLRRLAAYGRKPEVVTVDNGSEFTSRELETWAYLNDVKLDYIRPGKPVENCYIESFNGRFRDECLNANIFFTLTQVEKVIEIWREDYNSFRPHTSLGGIPPRELGGDITTRLPALDFSTGGLS